MLPLYLINVLGLDVMGAGPVLAAMAVGAFLSGAAARHVVGRVGAPGTVLIGLGLGFASAQLTGTMLRDIPVDVSGQGSATQSTVRQIGSPWVPLSPARRSPWRWGSRSPPHWTARGSPVRPDSRWRTRPAGAVFLALGFIGALRVRRAAAVPAS